MTIAESAASRIFLTQPKPLQNLREELLYPLRGNVPHLDFNSLKVKRVRPGEKEHEIAAKIINYGYNNAYGRDGRVIDLAHDEVDGLNTTFTLVAAQEHSRGENLTLGSLRFVCGPKLDIFELFETKEGDKWPHEQNDRTQQPGEIGKLSFHPLLNPREGILEGYTAQQMNEYQKFTLRMLYEQGMELMQQQGVEIPYFILAPHVLSFVQSAGIIPVRPVDEARPRQSNDADTIRREFNRYWNPDKSAKHQPVLYIAPWKLKPINT